jgi:hypothetical protein
MPSHYLRVHLVTFQLLVLFRLESRNITESRNQIIKDFFNFNLFNREINLIKTFFQICLLNVIYEGVSSVHIVRLDFTVSGS